MVGVYRYPMSSVFTIRCEHCEVDGPKVRRSAGGTVLLDPVVSTLDPPDPAPTWSAFLIEHEYHELRLVHE